MHATEMWLTPYRRFEPIRRDSVSFDRFRSLLETMEIDHISKTDHARDIREASVETRDGRSTDFVSWATWYGRDGDENFHSWMGIVRSTDDARRVEIRIERRGLRAGAERR